MRAMILAAGRGKRMGDITQQTPKPLLKVGDHTLIEHNLLALANAGFQDVIINVADKSDVIKQHLGDGAAYGIRIQYSEEDKPLETGGGIVKALPMLGDDQPFLIISADIHTDYPLQNLPKQLNGLAHIVLVDNPEYHPNGDFSLQDKRVCLDGNAKLTYANIGIYDPRLFADLKPGVFPLGPIISAAIVQQQVSGEYYSGQWYNVGTPDELAIVRALKH